MSRSKLHFAYALSAASLLAVIAGCGNANSQGNGSANSTGTGGGGSKSGAIATAASVEFPEGDPSVSAEDGGPGFTGEGWTSAEPRPLGDPDAVKGGTMLAHVNDWPENLRVYGTGANTFLNSIVEGLCYESLLRLDTNTLDWVPSLASHWKISDDKMTMTFRIDPRAHWSDGKPVTTDDVLATYKLVMDPTLIAPMTREAVGQLNEPVAKSKYIFEITAKEKDWRNFMTIAGLVILPAHEVGGMAGGDYLKKYNYNATATSGAYVIHPKDLKRGESITLTRRSDYWGNDLPLNKGLNNIDRIRFVVVRDDSIALEKILKGELDFYPVYMARYWVEDFANSANVKKGHLVRQKVYTRYPKGIQGLAYNMRRAPLDDVRVRKAIAHLWDRPTMLSKFAFNEYDPLKSYFPGGDGENPNNEMVEYDPHRADELLNEAGWTERGPDGIRVKDNKRLSFVLTYSGQNFDRYLTTLQEAARRVGIEIKLNLTNHETQWKNVQERNFDIVSMAWGATLFPSPKSEYHGEMATQNGSNNLTGLANAEADRVIDAYNAEFDADRRNELLRELDGIVFNEHPYALAWTAPAERVVYWNKFGTPDNVLQKYADWRSVFQTWWVDPQKQQALQEARRSGKSIEPLPPLDVKPWESEAVATAQD